MGFIEPRDNRTCFDRTSYLKELVELCRGDITLTLVKLNTSHLQMKTNCYELRNVCVKLVKCNGNVAALQFSQPNNAYLKNRIINFDVIIHILLTSNVLRLIQ